MPQINCLHVAFSWQKNQLHFLTNHREG